MERKSGILLHISSLPNKYGVGDFGDSAYKFVDFLEKSGQKLWQILPLGPTLEDNSPYNSYSTFAGNFLFISIDKLLKHRSLNENLVNEYIENIKDKDIIFIKNEKLNLLKQAYDKFLENFDEDEIRSFEKFKRENFFLENYAIYEVLKKKFKNKPWHKWEKKYKFIKRKTIEIIQKEENYEINFYKYLQYLFYKQWFELKNYANKKNIKIIGDISIYIANDSVDTWSNKKIFNFDKYGNIKKVGGCPPDYFSKKGQLWGNVTYNWNFLKKNNYCWWKNRIEFSLKIYDVLRLDHFRGFSSYWEVKYGRKNAIKGVWQKGPGYNFFKFLERKLGKKIINSNTIIAEDLGTLDSNSRKLLSQTKFPGIKIFQFAFDEIESEHAPHKYDVNTVAYTGTHDNETIYSWYSKISKNKKIFCSEYLKKILFENDLDSELNINKKSIEALMQSNAKYVIFPLQDILELGEESRMNIPGTTFGNWKWRMPDDYFDEDKKNFLKDIVKKYNR